MRQGTAPAPSSDANTASPAQLFQRGQEVLAHGQLDEAARGFRGVLAADPKAGGAYANLGVVYMRRKQWAKALEMLEKAERLMPKMARIQLSIGLLYYRQDGNRRDRTPCLRLSCWKSRGDTLAAALAYPITTAISCSGRRCES